MNKGKLKHTIKHHKQVLQAMKQILKNEPYDATLADDRLAEAIKDQGVFCSRAIVRKVRLENRIPCSDERRFIQFSKQGK